MFSLITLHYVFIREEMLGKYGVIEVCTKIGGIKKQGICRMVHKPLRLKYSKI